MTNYQRQKAFFSNLGSFGEKSFKKKSKPFISQEFLLRACQVCLKK